jgi:ankyrin repeat protein
MNKRSYLRSLHGFPISFWIGVLIVMLACSIISCRIRSDIHDAAKAGDLESVKVMLEKDPTLIFSNDRDGCQPLHLAALGGRKDVVELLLASNAKVNAKTPSGNTALHMAAWSGHKDVVELLLANNAEVNAKTDGGETPLYCAVQYYHRDVVGLLLMHGAELNAKNDDKATPLHLAIMQGNIVEVTSLLRSNASLVFSSGGDTPLHWAARYDRKDMAELLLANKADINAKDIIGMTPLHWAAFYGQKEMAEWLLAHIANAHAGDSRGWTPFVLAGNKDIVEILGNHGIHE